MAKFGPMVESCSTLPNFFVFCVFAKVSSWHFATLYVLPFYPNVVPARESHPGVSFSLVRSCNLQSRRYFAGEHISFRRSYNFEDVLSLLLVLGKQKEPITQSIKNRRERSSRFKVMFYVIGSEKSKSGSASYSSRQQNQRRGGAVRHFRCTDTVSDESDFHKICLNILIQFLCVDKIHNIIILIATFIVNICVGKTCHRNCNFFMNRGGSTFCCCPLIAEQRSLPSLSTAGEARSS